MLFLRVGTVSNSYANGLVARHDLLASQVSLADARQRLLQVQNALDLAHANYNRLLGRVLTNAVVIREMSAAPATNYNVQELSALALQQRPELAALSEDSQVLRHQAKAVRVSEYPQIAARGGVLWADNTLFERDYGVGGGLLVSVAALDCMKRAVCLTGHSPPWSFRHPQVLGAPALRPETKFRHRPAKGQLPEARTFGHGQIAFGFGANNNITAARLIQIVHQPPGKETRIGQEPDAAARNLRGHFLQTAPHQPTGSGIGGRVARPQRAMPAFDRAIPPGGEPLRSKVGADNGATRFGRVTV